MLGLRSHIAELRTLCRNFRNTKSVLGVITPTNEINSSNIIVQPLKNRKLINVRGAEAKSFLQGLITNDIRQLDERNNFSAMYALFLNRGGRVLYDTIIYRAPNTESYFIECDSTINSELRRYLRQYRVRRKIDIDEVDDYDLWVAFSPHKNININSLADKSLVTADPRLQNLGTRLFRPKNENMNNMSKIIQMSRIGNAVTSDNKYSYEIHRYKHGIAEGVLELPPGKCFPLETNVDYLNGINFQKGCYVGQELTARTYHTGVVRKRLMPLRFNSTVPKIGEQITTEAGTKVGIIRGICNGFGLGVCYVDKALCASGLMIDGEPCQVIKPNWWPTSVTDKKICADV